MRYSIYPIFMTLYALEAFESILINTIWNSIEIGERIFFNVEIVENNFLYPDSYWKSKVSRSNSSVRREKFLSVVEALHCSGFLWACRGVHFPVVELEDADRMTHCGMVPNGVTDSIVLQFTSLCGLEVLACSIDTDFNYYQNNSALKFWFFYENVYFFSSFVPVRLDVIL